MPFPKVKRIVGLTSAPLALFLPALVTGFSPRQTPVQTNDPILDAYLKGTPNDPITRLQKDMAVGRVHLRYDSTRGYMPALLNALRIPVSSQTLVFSRTSFQHQIISPRNPRALYFNDEVYVGWVPGGEVLEISTADPRLGAVFYTLSQEPSARPTIKRETFDCLQCHQGGMTKNVPGHVMRSVYSLRDGSPDFKSGTYLTNDASPMSERWGGWYVTGTHGTMRHMGNVTLTAPGSAELDRESGANVKDLSPYFTTSTYPTPGSDIVALLVLQHQVNIHTLLTQVQDLSRRTLEDEAAIHGKENVVVGKLSALSESAQSRLRSAGEPLVRALLFADEPLWTSPVRGFSGFTGNFAARGPQDKQGRSLRQFDLQNRLFRYPCSFIVYTPAFDALPPQEKEYLYRRLTEVLSGKDTSKGFDRLTPAQRQGIREILCDTKPDFAAFWKQNSASS
jgi:hypothetical protein